MSSQVSLTSVAPQTATPAGVPGSERKFSKITDGQSEAQSFVVRNRTAILRVITGIAIATLAALGAATAGALGFISILAGLSVAAKMGIIGGLGATFIATVLSGLGVQQKCKAEAARADARPAAEQELPEIAVGPELSEIAVSDLDEADAVFSTQEVSKGFSNAQIATAAAGTAVALTAIGAFLYTSLRTSSYGGYGFYTP